MEVVYLFLLIFDLDYTSGVTHLNLVCIVFGFWHPYIYYHFYWKCFFNILFFYQVPSVTDNPFDNLATFTEQIPLFEFIGEKKLIDDIPYDIHNDSDVQLVCKYLNALNIEKDHPGKGIDKRFSGQSVFKWSIINIMSL